MSGKDLKKLLTINNLTYEKAAVMLGISRGTLINWSNKDELSEKIILKVQDLILANNLKTSTNVITNSSQNIISGNNIHHNHIDNRTYNSDSPDVLRSQIDELDRMITEKELRIKEKDAQIKEKDAQIKDLHEIIKQLNRK